MPKRYVRKWSVGAVSASMFFSLLFPAASYADSSFLPRLPEPGNLKPGLTQKSLHTAGALDQAIQQRQPASLTPKSYVTRTGSSTPTTVIVELRSAPVKVAQFDVGTRSFSPSLQRNVLRTEHNTFKQAAARLGAATGNEYLEVFNGYAVTLPGNKVDELLKLPGVKAIYPNHTFYASTAAPAETETSAGTLKSGVRQTAGLSQSSDSSQISDPSQTTDRSQTSANTKVPADPQVPGDPQVLGDPQTPSFPVVGNGDLIGSNVFNQGGYTGKGVEIAVLDTGIDYNHPFLKDYYDKGGYDLIDNDDDPYETTNLNHYPDKDGRPYETSHGTHVSGIIKSVAPDADLYVYRVLGPHGSGTTDQVVAGIERAVKDGRDVINMSLGSSVDQAYSPDAIATDNAVKAGVTVVISAGNSGPDARTLGTPGAAHRAITVGASSTPVDTPVFTIGSAPPVYGLLASFSPELTENLSGLKLVYAGLGSAQDFAKVNAKGAIALVDRGGFNFSVKSENAKAAGAAALLIANNAAGELNPTLGEAGDFVPTYGITQAEGQALKDQLKAGTDTISFELKKESNLLADFSSRGPGLPDFTIKPDVVAPGVNVLSSVPIWESADGTYDTAYLAENGTSMAAPHVAGAAALLLQAGEQKFNKSFEPEQIKSILMNSARPISDRNGRVYDLYEQGAGLVDLLKAAKQPALAKVGEVLDTGRPGVEQVPYHTGSLSYGLLAKGQTVTKTVYLDNFSAHTHPYDIRLEWDTAHPGIEIQADVPAISVSETSAYFNVALSVGENAPDGSFQGALKLTDPRGVDLRLPFSVFVGESLRPGVVTNLDLTETIISPNADGQSDTADLSFSVNEPLTNLHLEVARAVASGAATVVGDVYATGGTYYRGLYEQLGWDGTVISTADGSPQQLEDGYYTITPVYGNQQTRLDEQAFSFVIDTGNPVVTGVTLQEQAPSETGGQRLATITGSIAYDLLAELVSGPEPADPNTLFSAAAVFENADGQPEQANGEIGADGSFAIDVPLKEGINEFYLYVYDVAGNGTADEDYVQLLRYSTDEHTVTVTPSVEAGEVELGKPVTVDVKFSATEAVYGAVVNMLYDGKLSAPSITPSVQLATYQEQHFPGVPLAEYSNTAKLSDGRNVQQYGVHVTDGAYSGPGSIARFTFVPTETGTYTFELSDTQIWNDYRTFTIPAGAAKVTVTVVEPAATPTPTPSASTEPEPSTGPAPTPSGEPTPTPTPSPTPSQSPSSEPSAPVYNGPPSVPGSIPGSAPAPTAAPAASGAPAAQAAVPVTDTALDAALSGPAASAAVIKLDSAVFTGQPVNVTFTAQQTERLIQSGRALTLDADAFALTLPAQALKGLSGKALAVTLRLDPGAGTVSSGSAVSLASPLLSIQTGLTGTPLSVELKLSGNAPADLRKVGIYTVGAGGQLTYLKPGALPQNGKIAFTVSGNGQYAAAAGTGTFRDIANHWAKADIEVLLAHGLVAGKGANNAFIPNDKVNQAELQTLLDRLLGKGDNWLTHSRENGARTELTRSQAAVLLFQALGGNATSTPASLSSFTDAGSIPANARDAIAFVAGQGYFVGENGKFNPNGKLTRAQTATLLSHIFVGLRSAE